MEKQTENYEKLTEEFLKKPNRIIDILPQRVKEDRAEQCFRIDDYFLKEDRIMKIRNRFIRLLLKLNCYYEMSFSFDMETYEKDPDPQDLADRILNLESNGFFRIFLNDKAMIDHDASDTYMTVYGADRETSDFLERLALSEGLFLWKPEDQK